MMILDASLVLDTFRILGSATAVTSSLLIPKSVMGLEAVLDTAEVGPIMYSFSILFVIIQLLLLTCKKLNCNIESPTFSNWMNFV